MSFRAELTDLVRHSRLCRSKSEGNLLCLRQGNLNEITFKKICIMGSQGDGEWDEVKSKTTNPLNSCQRVIG